VTAAVFVDRDGVLNELVQDAHTGQLESPLDTQQVALVPGAAAAIRRLRNEGYVVVGVSNQPAAAKGTVEIKQLESVQTRVLDLLDRAGAAPDAFRLCFHHPDGVVPELTRVCDCRKPAPGMLLDAAAALDLDLNASWMIGDTDADIAAGTAAGCRTILIENPGSAHKRSGSAHPDATVSNLADAADFVVVSGAR
jgi:D-glycero-D-manno-heptose 1,7-bisphosphate phosphatase